MPVKGSVSLDFVNAKGSSSASCCRSDSMRRYALELGRVFPHSCS